MRGSYRKRLVQLPPGIQNFKPGGIPRKYLRSIILSIDEYEAIRLADYHGLEHQEAADKMAISRPTFTRLIGKARQQVARALIDGMELVIGGGNVEFACRRHRCRNCGDEQVQPVDENMTDCPECGSGEMEELDHFSGKE